MQRADRKIRRKLSGASGSEKGDEGGVRKVVAAGKGVGDEVKGSSNVLGVNGNVVEDAMGGEVGGDGIKDWLGCGVGATAMEPAGAA